MTEDPYDARPFQLSPYDKWLATQEVPVHTGYYAQDVRTLERGWWDLRGCPGAVLNLAGQQGCDEVHVLEIPPGQSLPPFRMALDEVVYVLEGSGLASVWAEGHDKYNFEWQKHSLFLIPRNFNYQLTNARGDRPALTLHFSHLPLAMQIIPSPDYFFNNPYVDPSILYTEGADFYSREARAVEHKGVFHWFANFFPDLTLWDKLSVGDSPGRLSYRGHIHFPDDSFNMSMMVLPARRYRSAHRHAAGTAILGIQEAQGLVIMWPEGGDYLVVPWQEGSVFVPPYHWYHMHLNTGPVENRQLRIRAPRPGANPDGDPRRSIPFSQLDPWIRPRFEEELARNGLTSLMPEAAYKDPNFTWDEAWLNDD